MADKELGVYSIPPFDASKPMTKAEIRSAPRHHLLARLAYIDALPSTQAGISLDMPFLRERNRIQQELDVFDIQPPTRPSSPAGRGKHSKGGARTREITQGRIDRLEEELDKLDEERNRVFDKMNEMTDKLETLEEGTPEYDKVYKMEDKLMKRVEELDEQIIALGKEINSLARQLDEPDISEGATGGAMRGGMDVPSSTVDIERLFEMRAQLLADKKELEERHARIQSIFARGVRGLPPMLINGLRQELAEIAADFNEVMDLLSQVERAIKAARKTVQPPSARGGKRGKGKHSPLAKALLTAKPLRAELESYRNQLKEEYQGAYDVVFGMDDYLLSNPAARFNDAFMEQRQALKNRMKDIEHDLKHIAKALPHRAEYNEYQDPVRSTLQHMLEHGTLPKGTIPVAKPMKPSRLGKGLKGGLAKEWMPSTLEQGERYIEYIYEQTKEAYRVMDELSAQLQELNDVIAGAELTDEARDEILRLMKQHTEQYDELEEYINDLARKEVEIEEWMDKEEMKRAEQSQGSGFMDTMRFERALAHASPADKGLYEKLSTKKPTSIGMWEEHMLEWKSLMKRLKEPTGLTGEIKFKSPSYPFAKPNPASSTTASAATKPGGKKWGERPYHKDVRIEESDMGLSFKR